MTEPSSNPGFLKLDLYCRGMRIGESCYLASDGARDVMRTRAGLGSGLELVLPGGLWTNVPVAEDFARESPYELARRGGRYFVMRGGTEVAEVGLAPKPGWYDASTSTGKKMSRIGSLQGTYLGVYPAKVCEYWTEDTRTNCKFCSVGLNLGQDDADEKSVQEVLEVVHAAVRESNITYVDFNTGHYTGETYLDILEPYIRRIKEETGLLVGVQTPPHADLKRYDHLREIGVNRVSFCFELYNPDRFREVCPGKHRQYGLDRYLAAMEYCARLGKENRSLDRPWVCNGEIIAGLEPPEWSIKAIEHITRVGAIPTVCVFRPLKGTDYEREAAPSAEDLAPVFERMYTACMEQGLPIGVAPNVRVSLVLLPEEGRYFVKRPSRYLLGELKLAAMARLFRARFYRQRDRRVRAAVARA
ncbi:MAG: radical SAM protein [Acidobacteriota bacterium]